MKNKKVLDFGCGSGVMLRYLSDEGCTTTACENTYFDLVQKVCLKFNIKADIHRHLEQIGPHPFDMIFALDVFEHIPDLKTCLGHIRAVSDRKTELLICGPTENFLYKIGRYLAGFKENFHVRNIYDIERELAVSGFRKIRCIDLYPIFTLFRISVWQRVERA